MNHFEEDPSAIWYAAAALLLLVVFAVAVIVYALRSIGIQFNCTAIFGGLFLLGLLFVAIRPILKSK